MAKKKLKNIFLSASIPFKERHPKYYESADIIAIRDAVTALATTILPSHRLIWGGHPSITPIIYYVMERLNLNIQEHVTLYQSLYFERSFPEGNNKFRNIILTPSKGNQQQSVDHMRHTMFDDNIFSAGIFIGGMEGVEREFRTYVDNSPNSIILPIASTGGAAKIIYEDLIDKSLRNERLKYDYGYMSLFQDLLLNKD